MQYTEVRANIQRHHARFDGGGDDLLFVAFVLAIIHQPGRDIAEFDADAVAAEVGDDAALPDAFEQLFFAGGQLGQALAGMGQPLPLGLGLRAKGQHFFHAAFSLRRHLRCLAHDLFGNFNGDLLAHL